MRKHENILQRAIEEARRLSKRWMTSKDHVFFAPEIQGEFVAPEEVFGKGKEEARGTGGTTVGKER